MTNEFHIGDKTTYLNGSYVYELTAVGKHYALAINKEDHEVMLELENLKKVKESLPS
jgi:hypothetical protein